MKPNLRSLLARVILVGGVAFVGTYFAKSAPHEQTVAVRLSGHDVAHISGVVTRLGEDEPIAGFSQNFSEAFPAPRLVRHAFSAPNGNYVVVVRCMERRSVGPEPPGGGHQGTPSGAGERMKEQERHNLIETTFERRVSLAGGEVIVSPD